MQSKNNMKRKGFTLVELLIVIVVIGILSAMMMLSSTEAVTSAKASNIVSNLRNLKTAALAFYVDHMDAAEGAKDIGSNATEIGEGDKKYTFKNGSFFKDVAGYMSASDTSNELDNGYSVKIDGAGDWYVIYTIKGTTTEIASIQKKLAGRAKSVGLCKGGDTPAKATAYTDSDAAVAMFVR